jgi:hypothetical protein
MATTHERIALMIIKHSLLNACLGVLLYLLFSSNVSAQTCPTGLYSGCARCGTPGLIINGQNHYTEAQRCWTNAVTPRPTSTINYLGYTVQCVALQNIPCDMSSAGEPPQPGPNMRNVYRFYRSAVSDHFLTLDWSEGIAAGSYDLIGFKVFISPIDADMHVLYRCWWSAQNDHFVSTDPGCEGRANEGAYGYVSTIPRAGYVPLYRFYHGGISNHLSTTDYSEAAGYGFESIQGYVPE